MSNNRGRGQRQLVRWWRTLPIILLVGASLFACSGPESNDDQDPTPTTAPTATQSPTPEPTATDESSPTATEAASPTATESTATETESPDATGTPEGTAAATGTGTEAEATPQADQQPPLEEVLLIADELPSEGFVIASEGTRTAIELANGYADPSAHLDRLNQWGFTKHYFRQFRHEATGEDDPLPTFVLTTGNVYGSPEQAAAALTWLQQQNQQLGHEFVDPPPELGDAASASTVPTVDGIPTAIEFVQVGNRLYAFFAQGGDPLPFIQQMAEKTITRLEEQSGT